MVRLTTCRIKKSIGMSLCLFTIMSTSANWDDFVNAFKDAGKAVDHAFSKGGELEQFGNKVGDAIKDRFKDTKTTRSIDYGVRKAAFVTAFNAANLILDGSKALAGGSLDLAEKSAELSLAAGEHFLSDVVQVVSPKLLQGSADAAKDVVEAAKQTSLATLKGTRWVITNIMEQFDINRLKYEGDLKRLEHGVLGNVVCEGFIVGKQFSLNFDLDPRDLPKSLAPLLNAIENFFKTQIADPLERAFKPQTAQIDQAKKVLDMHVPDAGAAVKALEAAQAAENGLKTLAQKEQEAMKQIALASQQLSEYAKKKMSELEDAVKKAGMSSSKEGILSRQELVRRKQAEKKQ